MTRSHLAQHGVAGPLARVRAVVVIALMAASAGLLAEAGRQAEAQEAQDTYARTARPAMPSDVAGG